MIFGIVVTQTMMLMGGFALYALLLFQFLQGKRIIKFKGKLHMQVHRAVAWALVAIALFHGIAALAYFGIISF